MPLSISEVSSTTEPNVDSYRSSSMGRVIIGRSIRYTVARLSGLRVIVTSSPRNFALLRSLGADLVFSRSDPETPQNIVSATRGKLTLVIDCISEGDTAGKIAQCIGREGGIVSVIMNGYTMSRKDIECKALFY